MPFALVPWILALFFETRRRAGLVSGIAFGLTFWGLSIPWVAYVVTHFGGQPAWMGFVCVFLVAAILAEWPALLGWAAVAAFAPRSGWRLAAFPVLWMASEHARSVVYKGFPWNLTANALYRHPSWLQTASLWGAIGVGGLVAAVSAGLAALFVLRRRFARFLILAGLAAVIGGALLFSRIRSGGPAAVPQVRIACLQPNIPQVEKDDPSLAGAHYHKVMRLALEAAQKRPDLILIPESSLPVMWQRSAVLQADLTAVSRTCGCAILFNDIDEESEEVYYNAARLLTPSGQAPQTYRKVHLVPFGEYVPLPKLFFFMRAVTRAVGAFTAAPRPVVLSDGRLRIGPAVCYEMTYPELPREETRDGANLLATISNDAWYGKAGAQAQHFSAMVLRAIENGRPFARAAITGISGVVDERGRIVGELGEDRPGIVEAAVAPGRELTAWSRWGIAFPVAADAAALLVLVLGLVRWRRPS